MSDGLGGRELLSALRFCRHGLGVAPPLRNAHATGFVISTESSRSFRRLETLAGTLAADVDTPLSLRLPTNSLTTIDGLEQDGVHCEIYEQTAISPDRNTEPPSYLSDLRAVDEIDLTKAYAASYWHITLSRRYSLRVRATYAAVEIVNMDGPVSVVSSHGRVSFIDNTSAINAVATDGGNIVWSGDGAKTELRADLSIDLDLQHKAGMVPSVMACANGDVRLRLPESVHFPIGVYARDQQRLVNRASDRIDFLGPVPSGYSRFERTTGHEIVLGSVQGFVLIEPD